MEQPKITEKFPIKVQLEKGKSYSWCTCGLSEKSPFCDGKHKEIEGIPFRPLKFCATQDVEAWLCQCKHTKDSPFCDGSHKEL